MARVPELQVGVLAEFDSPAAMLDAARRLRAEGWRAVETFAPYDVAGADDALALPRPRLGRIAVGAALVGAALAYLVQWYTNAVAYPLNAGGRPPHAVPAFVPSAFETMGLFAAVAVVLALLVALRLPRLGHPVLEVQGFDRASADRYWVAIDHRDPRFDPVTSAAALQATSPRRVVWLGGRR